MPMHLTLRALREATNDWYLNIDNTILNYILFLELKKAFDTVDHQILLQECKLYGGDTRTISWFTSFLSDRTKCTYVGGSLSKKLPIVFGVPYGLASHADVLRGSSRVPAPHVVGQESVTNPKNVCVWGYLRVCARTPAFLFLHQPSPSGNWVSDVRDRTYSEEELFQV